VSKQQWDILRNCVYSNAYNLCEICKDSGRLNCHEVWDYDDNLLIQKLDRMIALCTDCHSVKHIGLANLQGNGDRALNHFMKINKISKKEADKHISDAFKVWNIRSAKTWKLDISILESLGIHVQKQKD
jgi:hypothetical protein